MWCCPDIGARKAPITKKMPRCSSQSRFALDSEIIRDQPANGPLPTMCVPPSRGAVPSRLASGYDPRLVDMEDHCALLRCVEDNSLHRLVKDCCCSGLRPHQ